MLHITKKRLIKDIDEDRDCEDRNCEIDDDDDEYIPKRLRKEDGNVSPSSSSSSSSENEEHEYGDGTRNERKRSNSLMEDEFNNYKRSLSIFENQNLEIISRELDDYNKKQTQPMIYKVLTCKAPLEIKAFMKNKLEHLMEHGDNSSADYQKDMSILETILKIPWGICNTLDFKGSVKDHLSDAMSFLDTITYGQQYAKSRLMLELAGYLSMPDNNNGFVLGVKGPSGVGKTTLISEGVSKLLNRPYYRINLDGASHSDILFGSKKVFEGAEIGDITKAFIKCQCVNFILVLEEPDSISPDDKYGRDLINAINMITDRNRNDKILDNYLGIHLDMSKVIIVLIYNNPEGLPAKLRSRIREIEITAPTMEDKINMTKQFLLPKICKNLRFDEKDIIISDEIIREIINEYTNKEEGVRRLEDKLREIVLMLNCIKMLKSSNKNKLDKKSKETLNNYGIEVQIKFPCKITKENLPKLLNL